MPCASYTDPRLAAVYDPLNPPGREQDFHLALAGERPCAILDLGCGTGRLACAFAARGHRVHGVDPAPAMLDIAQARSGRPGLRNARKSLSMCRMSGSSRFTMTSERSKDRWSPSRRISVSMPTTRRRPPARFAS
ncbi:MAG: class I SAM-dependent methyltransferase [Alphaproteobacteria bacterium]|nr:class I SAM-dependent methyltransferase [Alphaproteobacteria bacterium]